MRAGAKILSLYYRTSPPAASFIAENEVLRALVRTCLFPLIAIAWALCHLGPVAAAAFLLGIASISGLLIRLLWRYAFSLHP